MFYRNLITDNGFKEQGLISPIPHEHEFLNGQFPSNFVWAVATAAYQIEGGVTEGGQLKYDTVLHYLILEIFTHFAERDDIK